MEAFNCPISTTNTETFSIPDIESFNCPIGTKNTAGTLSIPGNEIIINATTEVNINHASGNQGVLISNIEIVGNDASSFKLINDRAFPFLVPVSESNAVSIQPLTSTNGINATVIVSYNNNQQLSIPITFDQASTASDDDFDLLLIIPTIIQGAVNNRN